jgi:hypothetical protein
MLEFKLQLVLERRAPSRLVAHSGLKLAETVLGAPVASRPGITPQFSPHVGCYGDFGLWAGDSILEL